MSGETFHQLSERERRRALNVAKTLYPQEMPCAVCGYRWMQHNGMICPKVPGHYFPLNMGTHIEMLPVMPTWAETTFIPDVDYYKEPDFDVS